MNLIGCEMKYLMIPLLSVLLLVSCVPPPQATVTSTLLPPGISMTPPLEENIRTKSPPDLPTVDHSMNANLQRSVVFITGTEILIRESLPPQIALILRGELPTPCHQLRVEINQPDAENKIRVDAYSVVSSQKSCIQVLEQFEENIELGSFPSGHYTVWVNESQIAEFDA